MKNSPTEEFRPSKYQEAIFRWVVDGSGDALVEAVAGSGKTTTLIEASKLIKSSQFLFCAFNKHIKQEIEKKINKATIKTIHSIGYKCLFRRIGNLQVEQYKYSNIVRQEFWKRMEIDLSFYLQPLSLEKQKEEKRKIFGDLESFLRLTRLTLTDSTSIDEMQLLIEHFRLESPYVQTLVNYLPEILERGKDIAITQNIIDYDDMVWLPNQFNLNPFQYQWIFVDEAQDLNKASLELILKSRRTGGRIIFVGDKNQAIYGFAGADSKSIDNIREMTKAQYFPLSICYRCPKSHVDYVKQFVSKIEAHSLQKQGCIKTIHECNIYKYVRVNDMVLCRLSAPLIKMCLDLINLKIPALIKGQDIGSRMVEILDQIKLMNGFLFSDFRVFLNIYLNEEIKKLQQQGSSNLRIQDIRDYCRGVFICYENFKQAQSINILKNSIMQLFGDEKNKVMLSTIHKAKGLENKRVFVLLSDSMPFELEGIKDWEKEQEINLTYVAYTRSKEFLFLVKTPPDDPDFW
jgi:superfamily I DNA/RNA helicase